MLSKIDSNISLVYKDKNIRETSDHS